MPPCLASPASETSGIAKTHKTATASARTLGMVPLPRYPAQTGRFAADDSMTAGPGNPLGRCRSCYFGLEKGARHFVHRHRRRIPDGLRRVVIDSLVGGKDAGGIHDRKRDHARPWTFYRLRDDGLVPLICPTCDMFSRHRLKASVPATTATLHGVVFDIFSLGARTASALRL